MKKILLAFLLVFAFSFPVGAEDLTQVLIAQESLSCQDEALLYTSFFFWLGPTITDAVYSGAIRACR